MSNPILHVVVPVYNERQTLEPCLRRILDVDLPTPWSTRLRVVDDHSDAPADASVRDLIERLRVAGADVDLQRHDRNRGKGAALQTAFDAILGGGAAETDLVVIQDADLEYDPDDFPALMTPLIDGRCDAVIGTRWAGPPPAGLRRRLHAAANRMLTRLSNVMTGYRVSDMECCYKVMPVSLLRRVRPMLSEARFGIEPQLIASFARLDAVLEEVPVRYAPRGRSAGKKIGWRDGVRALFVIARERARGRPPVEGSGR